MPAAAYRPTVAMHAHLAVTEIEAEAARGSQRVDQLLFGEAFDVLERRDGRAWGRARRTGSIGWLDLDALRPGAPAALFTVSAVDAALPLNALIHHDLSDVPADNLSAAGDFAADPVEVAERMLGVPHALGARSSRLTDCSGLVQAALFACGQACPRHSDGQAKLGAAVMRGELKRGDLVIWLAPEGETGFTGHSAFALDADRLIHATGHHGGVVIEDLVSAEARYAASGFSAPLFRRV